MEIEKSFQGSHRAATMTACISKTSDGSHWNAHAVRWEFIGTPLRPSPEDVMVVVDAMSQLANENPRHALKLLMLGVTPEYARFPWPPTSTLVAWERSESMIRHVWPGSTAENTRVIQGNWLHPPEGFGEFDFVLGDGVLTQLSFPNEYEELFRTLRALMRPGGRSALRLYANSTPPEKPDHVLDDVRQGRLTNVNEFKLRMGMALGGTRNVYNVAVAEIWDVWDQACCRHPALRQRWSTEESSTIEHYRESNAEYSFPPLHLVLHTMRTYMKVTKVCIPKYAFGCNCPTVILDA
jgi:hypothetical protein